MLKFVKQHMETIGGIEIFPIISFVIFFVFFVALLLWVLRSSKLHNRRMAALPLQDTDDDAFRTTQNHNPTSHE